MIRKASKKEFLKALRDESIINRLDCDPDKIRSKNNYVVDSGGCRLYFTFFDLGGKIAEMHVAVIKKHRIKARNMIEEALHFMKTKGFKKIITWAPEIFPSTINLAKNLGFIEIFREPHCGYQCEAVYLERVL